MFQTDKIRSGQIPACSFQAIRRLPDTVLPATQRHSKWGIVFLQPTATSVQTFLLLQPTTIQPWVQNRRGWRQWEREAEKNKLVKQSCSAETKLDINYQEAEQVLFVFPVITKLIKMQWKVKKREEKKQPSKQTPSINTVFFFFCFTSRLI